MASDLNPEAAPFQSRLHNSYAASRHISVFEDSDGSPDSGKSMPTLPRSSPTCALTSPSPTVTLVNTTPTRTYKVRLDGCLVDLDDALIAAICPADMLGLPCQHDEFDHLIRQEMPGIDPWDLVSHRAVRGCPFVRLCEVRIFSLIQRIVCTLNASPKPIETNALPRNARSILTDADRCPSQVYRRLPQPIVDWTRTDDHIALKVVSATLGETTEIATVARAKLEDRPRCPGLRTCPHLHGFQATCRALTRRWSLESRLNEATGKLITDPDEISIQGPGDLSKHSSCPNTEKYEHSNPTMARLHELTRSQFCSVTLRGDICKYGHDWEHERYLSWIRYQRHVETAEQRGSRNLAWKQKWRGKVRTVWLKDEELDE